MKLFPSSFKHLSLAITVICSAISLITYFLNNINKYKQDFVDFPIKKVLIKSILFFVVFSIFYGFIFALIFDGDYLGALGFIYDTIYKNGIMLFTSTLIILRFVYTNYDKRKFYLIGLYSLIFIIVLSFSLDLFNREYKIHIENILTYTLLRLPYYYVIVLGVHFIFYKEIADVEKAILKQQSLESQLSYQQLKNQLSPHFLFNNLNVLTSLIEENPIKAVKYCENLSHIYRYFLEQEKKDVVFVKDEIKFAKSYLELLKNRFEVGLNFSILIEEKVKDQYMVSTILQQVLENVVKHNEINEERFVFIKITSKENYLIIENNKNPKFEIVSKSKKGIENIRKRVAFFTDKKVVIEDTEKSFIIELPILEVS
jgi:sensor histidine kinase YesM